MSRIGNAPIEMPSGVETSVDGDTVTVKGPKGTLTRVVNPRVSVSVEDGVITVARDSEERESRAMHGLTRSLIANMVTGPAILSSKGMFSLSRVHSARSNLSMKPNRLFFSFSCLYIFHP